MSLSEPQAPESGGLPTPGSPEPQSVRVMFSQLAERYDRLNAVLSLGQDRRWRRRAAQLTRLRPGGRALDICTGTGALAALLRGRVGPEGEVVGVDLTEAMLRVGRRRVLRVQFLLGDATKLPFADRSFDAVTMAFGLRNIDAHQQALREALRVLRPGGRAVVLEFSTVPRWLAPFYGWYSRHLIPRIARRILGRDEAYRYLTESIARFPEPRVVAGWMRSAGFDQVRHERMSSGIVAVHVGIRSRER